MRSPSSTPRSHGRAAGPAAPGLPPFGLLIGLLRDDSPVVLREVRSALLRAGRTALPALRAGARSEEARVRLRCRALATEIRRERAWRRLAAYVRSKRIELEPALFLLATYQDPSAPTRAGKRTLDRLGEQLSQRLAGLPHDGSRARALGAYLGKELHWGGDREDYHDPVNASLVSAILRKRGLPLTLCALYRCVARRAGLEADLLPVPGHVLLAVRDGGTRTLLDPFAGGRVVDPRECRRYLVQNGLPYREAYFQPADDALMFARQVGNLAKALRGRSRGNLVQRLTRLSGWIERRVRALSR